MDKLNHEKYVSIDYDKWEKYYKPLEDTNKRLIKELHDLQESKK